MKYAVIDSAKHLIKVFDKCKDALKFAADKNHDATGGIVYNVEPIDYEYEHTLYIVFGESALSAYEDGVKSLRKAIIEDPSIGLILKKGFATEREKNAYLQGVEDSQDWYGYALIEGEDIKKVSDIIDNEEEGKSCLEVALEYIKECDTNLFSADVNLYIDIFGRTVEVESIYAENKYKVYVHVCCPEFEGDFDIESLSDENMNHIRNVLYQHLPKSK